MKSVADPKSEFVSRSDSEGEWQPLTDAQISAWANALKPHRIHSIVVYWGQDVEARRFFKSLQAVGRKINVPVTAGSGSANGHEVAIFTAPNQPVGPILLGLLKGLGCATSLDHYTYAGDETVGIYIPDRDLAFSPSLASSPSPTAKGVLDRIKIRDTPDGAILELENLEPTPTATPSTAPETGPRNVPPKIRSDSSSDPSPRAVPPKQGNHKERADKIIETIEARMKEINEVMAEQKPLLDFLAENPSLPITKGPEVPKPSGVEAELIQECNAIEKETGWIAFRTLATYFGALNSNISDFNKLPSVFLRNKILGWSAGNVPRMVSEAKQQSVRPL